MVATEPPRTAAQLPVTGLHQARWKADRAEVARCRQERPVQAPGAAPRARPERSRAAGQEPSAKAEDGAGRYRRELRAHWAEPMAHSAGQATAAGRSGPGPAAAAGSARPKEHAVRPAERVERPGRAPAPEVGPDGAAARARPGWPGAPPAARKVGAERSGPLQPGVPAQTDERPAAGPGPAGRRGVPARRVLGAPARRNRAGGADRGGRHRPTGPGPAGAMERRNCPATVRWRG